MTTNPLPLAAVRAIKEEAKLTSHAEFCVHDPAEYMSARRTDMVDLCDSYVTLVEALREYGSHTRDCEFVIYRFDWRRKCTCGYKAVLDAILSTIDPPNGEAQTEGDGG